VTPAAVTPAARNRPRATASRAAKPISHPRPVRARVAPAGPRRVSGPKPSVRSRPARPRSVSFPERAGGFIRSLPDHSLLDRLVRGRAWIPVLGVMLAGIVAMQVEVLKVNSSMGHSIALASSLQTRNELLRTSVSTLSNAHRIERLAERMGMVMAGPTSVDFLHGRSSGARAAAAIHVPDASAFDSALQARALRAAAATAPAAVASTPTSTGTAPPTTSSTAGAAASSTVIATSTATSTATATPIASGSAGAATTSTTGTSGTTGATATTAPGTTSATASTGGAAQTG
jgi:hypothetical protein